MTTWLVHIGLHAYDNDASDASRIKMTGRMGTGCMSYLTDVNVSLQSCSSDSAQIAPADWVGRADIGESKCHQVECTCFTAFVPFTGVVKLGIPCGSCPYFLGSQLK